jgi:hypothetical protein
MLDLHYFYIYFTKIYYEVHKNQLALKPNGLHQIVHAFNGQMFKYWWGDSTSNKISIEIKECVSVLHRLDVTTVIHLPS